MHKIGHVTTESSGCSSYRSRGVIGGTNGSGGYIRMSSCSGGGDITVVHVKAIGIKS